MSGKILIADPVSTNRIVLKVKLSAAHFNVSQASTGAEALRLAAELRPDLILASAQLSDRDGATLISQLRARSDLAGIPVVLILPEDTHAARMAALMAGADDVVTPPLDERVLLARLRSILRQHHNLHDLRVHAGPEGMMGFGEAVQGFQQQGHVAIVDADKAASIRLRQKLTQTCHHAITALCTDQPFGAFTDADMPDLFVLGMTGASRDAGLRLMAELRGAPRARHCRFVALVDHKDDALSANLMDMGLNDVISYPIEIEEISLRINTQICQKMAVDQLRDQLHDGFRAAMIDPLTGLYNRRFAMPFLEQLTDPGGDHYESFAVMLADLDHFKRINDQYGHAAGDHVLIRVAEVLRAGLREDDMIARIGGEEFLIVMPDMSRSRASQIAARLCQDVGNAAIAPDGVGVPLHVTISIGVTMGQSGTGAPRQTPDRLIDQADKALYVAKAEGRNKVTFSARSAA